MTTALRAPLFFLTSEYIYTKLQRDLILTHQAVREEITTILDSRREIKVLILDNVSCLFTGISEDKKQDWEQVNAWFVRLRHKGITTIIVHHSGKGGQQRGTSAREDPLDTVIQLERPT